MLLDQNEREIKNVWHRGNYETWIKRLSKSELDIIKDTLNDYIDHPDNPGNIIGSFVDGKRKIITSSWIPGTDWTGTVFQPIYDKACNCDEVSAAKCFGLIVQDVIINRPEKWMFGRYEMSDGTPIKGMTYFVVNM